MDRKKSVLNIVVSVSFQIVTVILGIVVKRLLIHSCGNEINGLNALYLSIVGILSVAELGVGSAISFSMYRPIVEGDTQQVAALYHLFDKLYKLIGGVVFLLGLVMIPFLPYLKADYSQLDVPLSSSFFFILLSSVLTYLFGAKTALINAYKNNYITSAISSGGIIIQYVLQAVTLIYTKSFSRYLACRIIAVSAQWIVTNLVCRKKYTSVIVTKSELKLDIKNELTRNIRAMFMHKIGTLLVNTVDSVVISAFIGVSVLGSYSNYTTILSAMNGVIILIFTSLTSVVGHFYAAFDQETTQKYCDVFHLVNFCVAAVFYLGYYAITDNLIAILFSPELVMDRSVVFTVSLNGFVQFMRASVGLFRDATGTFYNDRWKPLLEGIVNLVFSVFFVKKIGVTGVIVATILTNLLICHVIEPYVVYKNAFGRPPIRYYLRNYSMIIVYFFAQMLVDHCMQSNSNQWIELLVNGLLSVVISLPLCCFVLLLGKGLWPSLEKRKNKA